MQIETIEISNNYITTSGGLMLTLPAISGQMALISDIANISGSFVTLSGLQTITGLKTFTNTLSAVSLIWDTLSVNLTGGKLSINQTNPQFLVDINGDLRSTRYIMGTGPDVALLPVVGGQSILTSWWGLQLIGNRQSSVTSIPAVNIGSAGDYGIIATTQTLPNVATMSVRSMANQNVPVFVTQDISGTTWSSIDTSGNADFSSISLTPDLVALSGGCSTYIIRGYTSTNSYSTLGIKNSGTGFVIPNNSATSFSVIVTGLNTNVTSNQAASFKLEGLITNLNGTLSLQGTPSLTTFTRPTNVWSVQANANISAGTLEIQAKAPNGINVKWGAQVTLVNIGA